MIYAVTQSLVLRGNADISGTIQLHPISGTGFTIGDANSYARHVSICIGQVSRSAIPSQSQWDDPERINIVVLYVMGCRDARMGEALRRRVTRPTECDNVRGLTK